MDRFRQKVKKDKPLKYVEMEKSSSSFITDVKAIKENLKIKEILKNVKMSSSMRIKAPKGSKVMQNKDFSENEDIFDGDTNSEDTQPPSATNPNVLLKTNCLEEKYLPEGKTESAGVTYTNKQETIQTITNAIDDHVSSTIHGSNSLPDLVCDKDIEKQKDVDNMVNIKDISINLTTNNGSQIKARDRKLSLDQTMLSRREGLSQSELDLNSIGKSPLERKSSFFRKKMDSFLKNTTEIFKRQSIGRNQSMQRRGSMSVSLQSLNENAACNGNYVVEALQKHQEERQGSMASLQSSAAPSSSSLSGRSPSDRTLPDPHSEGESLAGSRPVLTASQPLGDLSSNSINSLNEAYIQESLLNSRAISMSSGLDSAHGQSRRKASRTNRVTWLASEGLTNYLRRVIQDEKSREIQGCHSFQDFSTIPESYSYDSKTDSKGRRLSYQRAVSGEDPRHYAPKRRQLIPEYFERLKQMAG